MLDNILDFINPFDNVTDFLNLLFDVVSEIGNFFLNFLKNIPAYFNAFVDFVRVYIIELPITLLSIFGELPPFVQTGLMVVLYTMYIAFAFKVLKTIIPFI